MSRESELALQDWRLLPEAFEESPIGVALLEGTERAVTFANPAFRSFSAEARRAAGRPPMFGDTSRVLRRQEVEMVGEFGEAAYCDVLEVPVFDEHGEIRATLVIASDVTESVRSRQAAEARAVRLEPSRRLLEGLLAHIPEGVTIAAPPDVRILYVSAYGCALTGRPEADLVGIPASEHVQRWGILCPDGETRPAAEALPLTRATLQGEVVEDEEWVLQRQDGTKVTILCNAGPIRAADGDVQFGVVAWRDIESRKRNEATLKAAAAQTGLLLQETNHRIKNSLQLVSSMLWLQSRTTGRAAVREELQGAATRVRSIAALHERLYKDADGNDVDFGIYLRELCDDLRGSSPEYHCRIEVETVLVPAETAIPLGLASVEMITNVIKHASAEAEDRTVDIRFGYAADGRLELSVRDHGVGVPDGFSLRNIPSTVGMRVIRGMVVQLNAELRVENARPGSRWTIRLPAPAS